MIGYKHAANSCLLCFSYVTPTDNRFYICKSDVIPTDNSFMHAEVTSPTTLTSSLISFVMAESKSRFATLSEEDLNLFLDDKDAKSIKRATKSALKVFHQYLKGKKADEPQTKDTLANMLKQFYAEARKADGTLSSLRFGLNRHFRATRGFDIINDSEFTDANKVFGAKYVDLKRQGLVKVEHKPPICELKKTLKNCTKALPLVLKDPEKLQNRVFCEVMLYFCRRGRQNLREFKKTDFSFNTDSNGARYVCKSMDELTKNRREDDEGFDGGLMYELNLVEIVLWFPSSCI